MSKLLILVFAVALHANSATAQWQRIADFGGGPTDGAVSFVINGEMYTGGGPGVADFWKYTPSTGVWTKLADIGGGPRGWAFGFAINGKGYIGGGDPNGTFEIVDDFWEYDPSTDTWTQKGDFPGGNRDAMFSFSIGDVGYAGGGFDGMNSYNDFWSYYPTTDTWTNLGTYPGGAVLFAVSAVIGTKAYVGTGTAIPEVSTFFEYNSVTNSWLQLADFPGGARQAAVAFAAEGMVYLGGGLNGPYASGTQYDDFYTYDPVAKTWTKWDEGTFPIQNLSWSTAAVINGTAYVGTGVNIPDFQYTSRFYKYVFGSELTASLEASGTMNMGTLPEGESRDTVLTLTNSGAKLLTITEIVLENNTDAAFSVQAGALPHTLNPGASVDVTLRFSPPNGALFEASLVIRSDASNGSELTIPVRGQGQSLLPSLVLTPTQMLFGYVATGTQKDTVIELRNSGQASLSVSEILIENDAPGAFSLPGLALPFAIEAGNTANVTVRFSPQAEGNFTARFTVRSNASNGVEQNANLIGVGQSVTRVLETSMQSIDFGTVVTGTGKEATLTLSNSGGSAITVSLVEIDGDMAAVFSVRPVQLPITVNPGGTYDLVLSYNPVFAAIHSAQLRIESDATNGVQRLIPITGMGKSPDEPNVELSRTAIDFGQVEVGGSMLETLVLSNTGNVEITVSDIRITGDAENVFSLTGSSLPGVLAPGTTADISVSFGPGKTGAYSAKIDIATNVPGSESLEVELAGEGIPLTGVRNTAPIADGFIAVYPNPTRAGSLLNYVYTGLRPLTAEMRIYNIEGQAVHTFAGGDILPGTTGLRLPAHLSAGLYYISIRTEARQVMLPFIIQ